MKTTTTDLYIAYQAAREAYDENPCEENGELLDAAQEALDAEGEED